MEYKVMDTQDVVGQFKESKTQIPSPLSKRFGIHRYHQVILRLHVAPGRDVKVIVSWTLLKFQD
jgi:hypothetical protein